MADTTKLKTIIEPYVREWLKDKYHKSFEEKELPLKLITGGQHGFDIVSKDEDQTIIGGIKAHSLNKNGKIKSGQMKSVFAELYFLSLIKAKKKLLIFTNKKFHQNFLERTKGQILPDIKIKYCPLSKDLEDKAAQIHKDSSDEIGKKQ
ncbi:hypothetical protein HYT45_02700 [Candidatus Uhrbacteria bacterium]|nr:hypothetical protein [Candidatus Uhrbacteria bacterium]